MLAEILLASGVALILYAIFKLATQDRDYFTKRGIKQMKPYLLFGNSGGFISKKYTAPEFAAMMYNAFPNEKLVKH